MFTDGRALVISIPAVVLALCLIGIYWTRDSMANLPRLSASQGLVDQSPWKTAESLAPLAVSAEEQRYARQAQQLADHEVDQAFAMALRQANIDAETRVLTGEALTLSKKVEDLQKTIKEDQAHIDSLTQQAKAPNPATASDDLEVAKAQLALDNDVLNDAVADLARQSGDKRSLIQQELAAHEASMHSYDEQAATGGQVAVLSAKRDQTLYRRLTAWLNQRDRYTSIVQAKQQTDRDVLSLKAQYAQLEVAVNSGTQGRAGSAGASATTPPPTQAKLTRLQSLKRLSEQSSILGLLGDRLQAEQQLCGVYDKWAAQVMLQHRIVWHLMLKSFAWIAFIVLLGGIVTSLVQVVLDRPKMDLRRKHTLQTIFLMATQVLTLFCVLLVIFGSPKQVPTIVGLATAGLTVAFQDFIIAFLGWFVLMGKHGIRVGDWVEINGVGGEVVEIGLFRTSMLETGNWTDRGHPTGRRVTFLNKFAIAGQYFNFSTTGQWMWDEITVNIPPAPDTRELIDLIHEAVNRETEQDAKLAEAEWQRVAKQNFLRQFTASPAVDLRPAASGTDVIVRYVTRASARFEMRNRLYQAIIELLHRTPSEAAIASATK
ncbi:MAG TPA: mechanosensitive ion channel domain-containing protein [Acidisarcina sp.]|nr:mechanosensitive ion channel domain-containing protein [Acidisarcina sp.]